ncbi:hypothetical protein [Rhizobium yanglingense]
MTGRIAFRRSSGPAKQLGVATGVLDGETVVLDEQGSPTWDCYSNRSAAGASGPPAYIDLELRTLQTIDNPFGTRLSPMC